MNYSFENLNQALIGMSRALLEDGVHHQGRRGSKIIEFPHPVMIEITNPVDRYVNIPLRKWNKYLPWLESLWLLLGMNDLDALPGNYVKSLYNYSDDGRTWRGGYGPRIRNFSGILTDYDISHPFVMPKHDESEIGQVDQLDYVLEKLRADPDTRQAIITIGDPMKDCFDYPYGASKYSERVLKETKDYPCTRSIQFMIVNGKLNCIVYMRSNDIYFGFSAVNVFNFTLMQEYIAGLLGLEVGTYYHMANNLHVYEDFVSKITDIAQEDPDDYKSEFGRWQYKGYCKYIEELEQYAYRVYSYEKLVRQEQYHFEYSFDNNMLFADWSKVILHWHTKKLESEFENPYLNKLFS